MSTTSSSSDTKLQNVEQSLARISKGMARSARLTTFIGLILIAAMITYFVIGQREIAYLVDPENLVKSLLIPALTTLAVFERRKITHRAIRPDNVFPSGVEDGAYLFGDCVSVPPSWGQSTIFARSAAFLRRAWRLSALRRPLASPSSSLAQGPLK